jgi:hypothetical protein
MGRETNSLLARMLDQAASVFFFFFVDRRVREFCFCVFFQFLFILTVQIYIYIYTHIRKISKNILITQIEHTS